MDRNLLESNIIEELGLESLPEERKIAIVQMMTDLVQKRVMLRIMEVLSETEKDEFEKILKEKGEDAPEASEFLKEKIQNLDEIVREEVIKVKEEALEEIEV
jgi:ElaB/YqjD/DUF883 family membrane-anchored ribosome-binding protein